MTDTDSRAQEIAALRKLAGLVLVWLVVVILGTLVLSVIFSRDEDVSAVIQIAPAAQRIWLCVFGATLGSSVSALLSAAERISHGWEFSGGDKYPQDEPKDKFVARMVPFFIVRPFLGAAMGLLVYAGISSGYLIAVENAEMATFSRAGLLFLSFLGGLFAKTFIEKLRVMFDTLFGS